MLKAVSLKPKQTARVYVFSLPLFKNKQQFQGALMNGARMLEVGTSSFFNFLLLPCSKSPMSSAFLPVRRSYEVPLFFFPHGVKNSKERELMKLLTENKTQTLEYFLGMVYLFLRYITAKFGSDIIHVYFDTSPNQHRQFRISLSLLFTCKNNT